MIFAARKKVLPETKRERATEQLSETDIVKRVVDYVTSGFNVARFNMCERGEISRETFADEIKTYIKNNYYVSKAQVESIYEQFARFVWSYYIIDGLIADPDISDIRITDASHVYIKKRGVRSLSGVRFESADDYERFIERVALKNKVNMANNNAINIFTDKSQKDWILRFNLSTKFVLSAQAPMLHIRKHARKKKLFPRLVAEAMLSEELADTLRRKIEAGESFLVCGAGSAGKTTLMNAMLEIIPMSFSIFCVQESEELFSLQPREFCAYHIVENRGGGKLRYSLEDISRNGLLVDSDVYMIGEIKGGEAKDFLYAVHTGAICYASIHANSPRDAYFRPVDYVKRSSSHSTDEIMFMLRSLKNCIFMKKYKIQTIAEVGWSEEQKELTFHTIYERRETG